MALNTDFFVAPDAIQKTLTLELSDGRTVEQVVYVKELGVTEFRRYLLEEAKAEADGTDAKAAVLAALIARTIVDEAGQPEMTLDQASQLKPLVANSLRKFILGANGLGEA